MEGDGMALIAPPTQTLPVSKGGDLIIDFMQKVDGVYTAYAAGVTVTLEIDIKSHTSTAVRTVAGIGTIAAYHAVCRIESEVADKITDGSLWRCVVSYPTFPQTSEVIAMNGKVQRADGE